MGLRSEDAYITELQTALRIARALKDATGVFHQPSHSPIPNDPRTLINSITLPSPHPLLPSLLEAGLSHEIGASISEAYKLRAEELRRRIHKSIVTACRELAELPVVALASPPDLLMRKVVLTSTELYLRRLEQWKEEIIQRIKQAQKPPINVTPRNSRNFNQEYVPLLEHFFEENPFPTHADKVFLAKKSDMQYRQIHVWFQNRRNRTKKEGKTLRKKPTYEGATKPLDRLYERMRDHIVDSDSQAPIPSKAGSSEGTTKTEIVQNNASKDAFTSSSPPHAFPSSYPPTCHYDPFPCKGGSVPFSKPEWERTPYGKSPLPLSTNIDDLVERFSHLNVRDETRFKGSPKLQSHAATAAITVIPSRAPHPSLLVSKYLQPTNIVQLHLSVRAPVSRLKVFQSPSPTSKPVTLVPNKNEVLRKRKTAPMVDIEDQSFSVNAVLSRILTRSDQYLNTRPQPAYSPSTPARNIHVDLPEPPALLPALVAAGARLEVAQAMQATYHRRACEFREQALATISRACGLAQIPSTSSHTSDETIIATFKKIYLKKLNTWISEGVALLQEKGPSVLRCREDNESAPTKISKTFNHAKHFFEENPFPTHADKVFLAKKSNMTYRQIHVWFQNRRNRTKKALHKKPVLEGVTIPLDTLVHKMGKFAIPPTIKSDAPPSSPSTPVGSSSYLVSFSTKLHNVLGGVAPLHAFPTIYPPSCEYNPFPSVPVFVTPEWSRRSVPSSERPRHSVMDVDELTEKFSRLNVWDDSRSRSRSRRKAGKVTCDSSAATSAITIKPSPAPHPACIRFTAALSAPPRITLQPIPATASTLHVFRSPSPNSPMTTLIPTLAHRRKVAPLPKRIPSRPSFTLDLEISGNSTTSPSLTSSSRSSSLGSEASIQDSRFTYNRSSNSSSTVTTPETSPSQLSHPP
ncbi:hypothetical protein J3R83DRAFT_6253 [Lanmaoa asiatica]|nr:hypothetical protein J3R83DRAFT_6253 [Lanmaoa asiatica]